MPNDHDDDELELIESLQRELAEISRRARERKAGVEGKTPEQRRAEIRQKNRRIKAVAILAGAAGTAWAWIGRNRVATAAIATGAAILSTVIIALPGAGPARPPRADQPTTAATAPFRPTGPPTAAMLNPPTTAPTPSSTMPSHRPTAAPATEPTTSSAVTLEPTMAPTGPAAEPVTTPPPVEVEPTDEPTDEPVTEPTSDPTVEPPATEPPDGAGQPCLIDLNLGPIRICL